MRSTPTVSPTEQALVAALVSALVRELQQTTNGNGRVRGPPRPSLLTDESEDINERINEVSTPQKSRRDPRDDFPPASSRLDLRS